MLNIPALNHDLEISYPHSSILYLLRAVLPVGQETFSEAETENMLCMGSQWQSAKSHVTSDKDQQ